MYWIKRSQRNHPAAVQSNRRQDQVHRKRPSFSSEGQSSPVIRASVWASLDHLVGAGEQNRWHRRRHIGSKLWLLLRQDLDRHQLTINASILIGSAIKAIRPDSLTKL
jgi:hypothetical protein